jgi:hypothetical protein
VRVGCRTVADVELPALGRNGRARVEHLCHARRVIEERMRRDLTAAMKAGDRTRVSVLRTALAAIANAEAPAVEARAWPPRTAGSTEIDRIPLGDVERRAVITAQIADSEDTAAQYERHGRTAEAATMREEITILREYTD